MIKIDKALEQYLLSHIEEERPLMARLFRETHLKMVNGRMCTGHLQGSILTLLSKLIHPARVLDIGTYTGYSALCLVNGLSDSGILHTIEINDEFESLAAPFFEASGMRDRIIQHIGDADDIIPQLNEKFDLVFIDADKRKYLSNYNLVFPKVTMGGVIIADNTLWAGKVVQQVVTGDEQTIGIMQFNDFVKNDPRVETFMIPVRDGMTVLRKISE
ncbi:MAG: O-methyltransferase [Bacteroidia bacterium]|nr:O-methyltransferase [Bacteroidia bacterium]